MPLPPHCKPSPARYGRPAGKRAHGVIRVPEYSGCIERVTEHCGDAFDLPVIQLHRTYREQRMVTVRPVAPIEGRMRVEDLQAAHHEDEEPDNVEPMGDPYRKTVPIDFLSYGRWDDRLKRVVRI